MGRVKGTASKNLMVRQNRDGGASVVKIWYLEVVSGRRRDVLSRTLWCLLWVLSLGYGLIVKLRNSFYDFGILSSRRAQIPILSVGNLSTGGTGKTPTVAFFAQAFRAEQQKPAIVARGYGSKPGELNDEGQLLELLIPGLGQFQNPNRWASVTEAERQGFDVVVLDDGFQHRQLARDFELLLIDATNPKAYGYLLPAGLLRDQFGQLSRADAILITRTNQVTSSETQEIRGFLRKYSQAPIYCSEFPVQSLVKAVDGSEHSPEILKNRRIGAICGIGNPQAFRQSLANLGAEIGYFAAFPDHHPYQFADWQRILENLDEKQLSTLVMTDKDAVKLGQFLSKTPNQPSQGVFILRIGLKVESEAQLLKQINEKLWATSKS